MMWEKIPSSNLRVEATIITILSSMELVVEPQQQSREGISKTLMLEEWTIMPLLAVGVHTGFHKTLPQVVSRLTLSTLTYSNEWIMLDKKSLSLV